ncbi:MAG: hypothetical protein ACOCYZ_06430 [Halococcoides sp.]
MPDDIDAIADSLGAVQAGPDLGTAVVTRVEVASDAVELALQTPAGSIVRTELVRPPVWGPNCALADVCAATGVEPPEFEALEGADLPIRRVEDGRPRIEIDREAL